MAPQQNIEFEKPVKLLVFAPLGRQNIRIQMKFGK